MLERHGYHQHDDQHTGRAIGLIGDLARIYEGTQDAPAGTYHGQAPPSAARPGPTGRTAKQTRTPSSSRPAEVRTVLAALDEAADYKRDRAETCADCPDQSCPTCQWRLQDAQTYDQLAAQMLRAAESRPGRHAGSPRPAPRTQPAASPSPQPTRRPASDHPRQDTGRTRNPPPSRRSPCPCPAAGGQGHARDAGPL